MAKRNITVSIRDVDNGVVMQVSVYVNPEDLTAYTPSYNGTRLQTEKFYPDIDTALEALPDFDEITE